MALPEYLIKFSVSLSVLYIFYHVALRRLTFYQWNRFYLLGYSLLSFVLPFINVMPWISNGGIADSKLVSRIPAMGKYSLASADLSNSINISDWLMILFCAGLVMMLMRTGVQYISLRRIRANSVLLHANAGIRLYETVSDVSPFSFGNSIFINRNLHSEPEMQRIIQHEIVHVRQQHTVDLVVSELLCMVNWYNPFAWLIRNAIRQNLEFIADNNVLAKGYDKKEYQYLLLKVVGVAQYSIANNFNLPDLKKRIIMMNKMKSARLHLTKFLFVLPVLALILIAFRSEYNNVAAGKNISGDKYLIATDTVPPVPPAPDVPAVPGRAAKINDKGFIVTIADNNGECIVLAKDASKKIVKAMTLTEWDKNRVANEKMYGKISPPPPRPVPPVAPVERVDRAENQEREEPEDKISMDTQREEFKEQIAMLEGEMKMQQDQIANNNLHIINEKMQKELEDQQQRLNADIDRLVEKQMDRQNSQMANVDKQLAKFKKQKELEEQQQKINLQEKKLWEKEQRARMKRKKELEEQDKNK